MIKINLNTILLIIVTIISFTFHIKYERYKFPKNLSNLAKKFANDFNQLMEKKDINVKNLHGHAFHHIEGKLLDETIFVRRLVGESFQVKSRTVSNSKRNIQ